MQLLHYVLLSAAFPFPFPSFPFLLPTLPTYYLPRKRLNQGQDLAPGLIKRAFFGIEIISFLGAENFQFLEGLSWSSFFATFYY